MFETLSCKFPIVTRFKGHARQSEVVGVRGKNYCGNFEQKWHVNQGFAVIIDCRLLFLAVAAQAVGVPS
ncbi:hypothetical protein N9B60_01125 [Mariniblastus sp.]|nr:hypothetical protein [Mariniblastus sp.]